jgi:hypothetical protein
MHLRKGATNNIGIALVIQGCDAQIIGPIGQQFLQEGLGQDV